MQHSEIEGRRQRQLDCSADIEMRFFPEGEEKLLQRLSPCEWSKFEKLGPTLAPGYLSYLGPFLSSSPEDEKCIKHYRHSVSYGGQHPPIERLSSFRSRFSARLDSRVRNLPFATAFMKNARGKWIGLRPCSLPSLLLVRWDLFYPLPYRTWYWSLFWSLLAVNSFRYLIVSLNLSAFAERKYYFYYFLNIPC